jgi:Domain of unknown function (DUF4190)
MSDQNPNQPIGEEPTTAAAPVGADAPVQPQESMWQAPGAQLAGGHQVGGQQQFVAAPQTSSNAIVALVLAITSWVVCPIIFAIVALVFANMGSKEIKASGGRVTGEGLVTGAKVVAWINIGLWTALILIGIFAFAIIAVAGGMSSV